MCGKSLKEGDFENVAQMKNQAKFYKNFHFFPKLLLTRKFKVGKLFKVNKIPLESEQVHEDAFFKIRSTLGGRARWMGLCVRASDRPFRLLFH